jgi:hypothetical protein
MSLSTEDSARLSLFRQFPAQFKFSGPAAIGLASRFDRVWPAKLIQWETPTTDVGQGHLDIGGFWRKPTSSAFKACLVTASPGSRPLQTDSSTANFADWPASRMV